MFYFAYKAHENLLAIPVSSCQVDRSGMPSELSNKKDINFSHYSSLIRLYQDTKQLLAYHSNILRNWHNLYSMTVPQKLSATSA